MGLSELCVVVTGRDGKPKFAEIGLKPEYNWSGLSDEAEELIGSEPPPGSMLLPGKPRKNDKIELREDSLA